MRAARRADLLALRVHDRRFGWPLEQVLRAGAAGWHIAEVPVPTRYFPEASSASFIQSSVYGLSILLLLVKYELHRLGLVRQRRFESLTRRYLAISRAEDLIAEGKK